VLTACRARLWKSARRVFEKCATLFGAVTDPFLLSTAPMHFGLHAAEGALLFVLRKTRTALLIDGIDKMGHHDAPAGAATFLLSRRAAVVPGLTALDQSIVPVVKPEGFLSPKNWLCSMRPFWQADNTAATAALEEADSRNDSIGRNRTAIVRPAAAGRKTVCRFGKTDC